MQHRVEFNITSFCQAKCRSCSRTVQDTGEMVPWLTPAHTPYENFKVALDNLYGLEDLRIIELCGELGDPMMHPDIEKIVELITSKGYHCSISTNGGLRGPDTYKRLAQNENVSISFGIDGVDHDTNWRYREGVDWQRAWNNMITFRKHLSSRKNILWCYIVFQWNWKDIEKVYQLGVEHDIPVTVKINSRDYGIIDNDTRQLVQQQLRELSGKLQS
jgi:MoaA/NifB/PqqE/SkfB family radical SAM enzyme